MPVYVDHAATTPISAPALAALTRELSRSGNPSSLHGSGRRARRSVEDARETIAAAAGAHPSEVVFTSGGTEADNLAIKGLYWARRAAAPGRNRILCSTVEHHAVQDTVEWLERHEGAEVVWLPVDGAGVVSLEALRVALAEAPERTALVTVMWANNEVGTVQPVHAVAAEAARFGVPVHSDAVQAFGSLPVSFADSGLATMAVSAHKIGGPVGVGALLVGRAVSLTPVQHGGGQERDIRSGTLDGAGIVAFAAAAHDAVTHLGDEGRRLAALRDRLIDGIRREVPQAVLRGVDHPAPEGTRLPGNVHFTFPRLRGGFAPVPPRPRRHRIVDRLGVHGGRAAAVPRPARHGAGRGRGPGRPAVQPGAYIHRRRR
ncbi:cysteine desulfurase [Arthrobacter sp. MN05-02]|nr:cysteine desulfurase [Arthrobacter sp. MN05-02]